MPSSVVTLDLGAGVAHIAGTTIGVRARQGGALEVGGRIVRPLHFGERWRLLDDVAAGESPLGAAVLAYAGDAATVDQAQAGDDEIAQIIALHLAGARPERAVPGFAAQLAQLGAAGWTPRDVFDADADLVDLLTVQTTDDPAGAEWTTIVVVPDVAAATSPADALRALERNLLDRRGFAESDEALTPARSQYRPTPEHPSGVDVPAPLSTQPEATWPWHVGGAGTPPAHHPVLPAVTGRADIASDLPETPVDDVPAEPSAPIGVPPPIRLAWSDRQGGGGQAMPGWRGAPPDSPRVDDPPDPAALPQAIAQPTGPQVLAGASTPGPPPARRATTGSHTAPTVVADSRVARRTGVAADPGRAGPDVFGVAADLGQAGLDVFGVADQLAALLDDESDLRGLRR